jgi:putative endopeptidase
MRSAVGQSGAEGTDFLGKYMDRSVDPATDFFTYANGSWLKANPIPDSESTWGIGNLVQEELYTKLRTINEKALKNQESGDSESRRIADFWATATNASLANQLDLAPLQVELEMIDAISNAPSAIDVAFKLRPVGIEAFFSLGISQDEKQSDLMAVHLGQGGLGLPERDFYFNSESGTARIRREYVAHIARLLKLIRPSEKNPTRAAENVMEFETHLAKISRKLEDLRDPEKNYHRMTPSELQAQRRPLIQWNQQLASLGLAPNYLVVGQPEFFAGLNRLLARTSVETLQHYLRFHLVSDYSPYLSQRFDDENFTFYHRVLSGQKEPRPRWKRVLDAEEHAMGMILGKRFVEAYFPETAKRRYTGLVEMIRAAYRDRIDRLTWMSAETKAAAREKLERMHSKVGFPEKWKDYSKLVVGTNSFCENMKSASRWQFADAIDKLGKPVDRSEWEMTPQTYNAYYNPANNEIVLPAAIFSVPGIPDDELDDAVVYGYAGASTIGHEITHGFDDEGRKFDGDGDLKNWWKPEDAARFEKGAKVMVEQFNQYEPLPGLHINGQASLGENLADYGGLLLSLEAFKKTEQFKSGRLVAGLTPLQRFFLGYALGWQSHQREESLRQHLLADVHAPAKWRVNGPLSNIPEFHSAFQVKPGTPLWRSPENQVKVW